MKRFKYAHIYITVLITLWLGLFIDSTDVAQSFANNQWLTNVLVFAVYLWIYTQVSQKLKKLMLFALIVALGGEMVFSLLLGMYHYRLDNVPLYVPPGHAIIYISVYYLSKEPLVQKYRERIIAFLYPTIIIYSSLWLFFARDVFGFLCMVAILWLFKRRPQTKLFFLLMFFFVVYLELLGTYYNCWQWPGYWFGKFEWMPSANPPSGISLFYFGFDAGCLWVYKKVFPERWKRLQRYRIAGQT